MIERFFDIFFLAVGVAVTLAISMSAAFGLVRFFLP